MTPPATPEDRRELTWIAEQLVPGADHARTASVNLLEELSPAILFGAHGDIVVRVIEAGTALGQDGARGGLPPPATPTPSRCTAPPRPLARRALGSRTAPRP
ncbi:hypothetical protein [Streptomyces sp. NPDC058240]|uniref:hypothetical protein n=1 Tax=Streptomyces sp. NPDC058240 TaxID=3346396 RepID=UPI0036F1077A